MLKSLGLWVMAVLCVGGCNVEHYEGCDDELEGDYGAKGPRAGSSSRAGSTGGDGKGGNASGGSAGAPEPPATPCNAERDCDAGFNCNLELGECQPADAETCGELETEPECSERSDCIAVYGGIDCSCGADCECQGGEPGCICESFEYLVCRASE